MAKGNRHHTRPRGTRSFWAIQQLSRARQKGDARAARKRARQNDRKIIQESVDNC